jgi:hypothetical protein
MYPDISQVLTPTLTQAMRLKLNFSYKKCSQRPLPPSTKGVIEQHLEAATIIAALRRCKVPVCYIDEYNVSEQDLRLYSWLPKGSEDYLHN